MTFEPLRANQTLDELVFVLLQEILEGLAGVLEAHAAFLDYLAEQGYEIGG